MRVNEIMLSDSAKIDRFLLIRYEDFVTSPDATLERLSTFLGAPFADLREGFNQIDQGGVNGEADAIENQNHASIRRLDQSEIVTIMRLASPLFSQYGYDAC